MKNGLSIKYRKNLTKEGTSDTEDYRVPDRPRLYGITRYETGQIVTTNITTTMDALLVLISLSFHYAYATSYDEHRRFVKRQQVSSSSSLSSKPTHTSSSTTTHQSSEHSLPASIQTRIPIPPSPPPGGVQTAIPEHPGPNSAKGPIIGFGIGIVVLVLLFITVGWFLSRRYKQRKQQQAISQNTVQLQPTSHCASSFTKTSFDDTQSTASRK
jgi:hypothetical protein